MIFLSGVSKIYRDGVVALDDIDLTINRGEFVFIIGPSGAGKSSFIKLLSREERPTEGIISVFDTRVDKLRRNQIPRYLRGLGIVFQDFKLLDNRTAYENVAFALIATGQSSQMIKESVPAALRLVGLGGKMDKYPAHLSWGEQQRVCIARAIANRPRLLLADEPTGNLDPKTSLEILEIFEEINIKGTTVVIATHDRELVDLKRRRVIELRDGHIVRDEERGGYHSEA